MPHGSRAPSNHLQIVLLAVAMGLQSVIVKTISLTAIVFTPTLSRLMGTIADRLQTGYVAVVVLPFVALALAFAVHRQSRRPA